jgi:urease accessory protein
MSTAVRSGGAMRSRAAVGTAERDWSTGRRTACLTTLRSDAPVVLRPTRAHGVEGCAFLDEAMHVSVAAGAAGPLGGDHFCLDVDVGDGTALVLAGVSSTLALPGRQGATSRLEVTARVGREATLVWLARPVIAASGCDHITDVRIDLAPGARLVVLEQAVLGRHGEPGGLLRQRTRVTRGRTPLYCQDLTLGDDIAGSPVVASGNRALGSLLVIDPAGPDDGSHQPPLPAGTAVLRLAGGGQLVSALAVDTVELRRRLRAGAAALGPPWDQLASAVR